MRKEIILAVIIGVALGGIILYGINLANNSSNPKENEESSITQTSPVSSQQKTNTNAINFITPIDHAVVTDDKIDLKGTTKPNANLAIITENDDTITTSDTEGNFSASITLSEGENKISVTSVDSKMATSSAAITIIHTASIPE